MAVYYDISGNVTYPIDLDAAKRQLRIDPIITYDDTRITEIIAEATEIASDYTGRRYVEQDIVIEAPAFITDIEAVFSPITSISAITYLDVDGNEQSLVADTDFKLYNTDPYTRELVYIIDPLPELYSEQTERLVKITGKVGYTATTLPKGARSGIMLLISYLYENRNDSVDERVRASQTILRRHKQWA